MPKVLYNGIEFESEEERLFYIFLEELQENGFIDNFTYQTEPFQLSKKVEYEWKENLKTKEITKVSTILQPHEYKPDFKITWNIKAYGIFYFELFDSNKLDKIPFIANKPKTSFIEIKPNFDYQNMTRLAVINIKFVYEQYQIYVQKVVPIGKPNCLFAKTFVPIKAMVTSKTKKPKKYKFEVRSLQDFINTHKMVRTSGHSVSCPQQDY